MPIILDAPDPIAPIIPLPGVDYAELAEANWAEAQLGAELLKGLALELLTLAGREARGSEWLRDNVDDPQWGRAVRLHQQIGYDIKNVALELAAVERRVWKAVVSTYVAVRMDGKVSTTRHNQRRATKTPSVDVDTLRARAQAGHCSDPAELWHSLVGDRTPPGSFPAAPHEDDIETMKAWPYSQPAWCREELEALLKKGR